MSNFNFEKMPDKKLEFIKELDYYQKIVNNLSKHPEFQKENLVNKITLSFLVESEKKERQVDWEKNLNNLISQIESYEDFKELSWFLADYIGEKYLHFLDERIQSLNDNEELKKKVQLIKQGAQLSLSFSDKLKEEGKAVSLPGIAQDYSPKWRQYI